MIGRKFLIRLRMTTDPICLAPIMLRVGSREQVPELSIPCGFDKYGEASAGQSTAAFPPLAGQMMSGGLGAKWRELGENSAEIGERSFVSANARILNIRC
jgi:hypothetical protein